MTPEEVVEEMKVEFVRPRGGRRAKPRKYVGGLLPAFCEFLLELDAPGKGYRSLDDLFKDFPQITEGVSTLTVQFNGGQKTIRPAYERMHRYYIHEHKRLDYPRSAPYGTGKWSDYRHWLDSLVTFTREELERVRDEAKQFVLDTLPEHRFDPSTVRIEPPIFKLLLRDFPFRERGRGEPTGAAFQAMVFAYIRADAPHLQVESRKVRTGSSRQKGIGDIDAWEGDRLVISAEVKHYVFGESDLAGLEHFTNEIRQRAALGFIVAENFQEGIRERVEALGLFPLTQADILAIVSLWDPLKQRAALNAFQYVVVHKEQNSALITRVDEFLVGVGYKTAGEPLAADVDEQTS